MFWLLGLPALLSSIPLAALMFGGVAFVSIGFLLVSIAVDRDE